MLDLHEFVDACRSRLDLQQAEFPDEVLTKMARFIEGNEQRTADAGRSCGDVVDVAELIRFGKLPAHEP